MKKTMYSYPTLEAIRLRGVDVIRTSVSSEIQGGPIGQLPEDRNEEDLAPNRGGVAATVNPVKPEPNSLPH